MSARHVAKRPRLNNQSELSSGAREITRRDFIRGGLTFGVVTAFGFPPCLAFEGDTAGWPPIISGNSFHLTVEAIPVNFSGRRSHATAVNGSVPGPTLHWREGDTVTLAVTNHLKATSSIHWHGVRLPSEMDGVPGLSFAGIPAGETFIYRFPVRQSGTYWYHSHSRFQEQTGLYGALIIEPQEKHPIEYDREYVIIMSDWTDMDPEVIYSNLKQQSDFFNFHQRTVGSFASDVRKKGLGAAASNYLTWARMNMSPTDILDVSGAAYTYLINGYPPSRNWTGLFRPNERIRLRFINASSMSIFDVRIPGLPMAIVQSDGNDVEPVEVDEFRISVAETYDAIVQPREARAYTIFVQAEDRTGYARGTLAPAYGMSGAIPPMDPRPERTMMDMGMQMHGVATKQPAVADEQMSPAEMNEMAATSGMSRMSMTPEDEEITPSTRAHMLGDNAPGQPGPRTSSDVIGPDMGDMRAPLARSVKIHMGPQVNNVAEHPTSRLASAGAGFPAGRRVLTYSDLRAVYRGTDPRPPSRELELHLTGNMERFIWGFDGEKFSEAEPIRLKLGERVRIILINDSMMEHPIHLHGLWSELENGQGGFRPYKHTINVKPGERLSYLVSADTPGQWAYHCHLVYHMEGGMFRAVIVS
jgi:CopA family copper-resistance protein